MSDFEDAKLILTPNAYKSGKAYSVKPFDGSGDLTVVRNTTATRVDENGLIEVVGANVPRLNYPIGGGCPSWLIEPQATNLVAYSEDFSDASWFKTSVNVNLDSSTSPKGDLSADTLIPVSNDSYVRFFLTSVSLNTDYTFSFYAKANTSFDIRIRQFGSTSGSGTIKVITVTNEWKRYSVTSNSTNNSVIQCWIGGAGSWVLGEDLQIWGAQLEQGNLTSYIPTNGTTVTRNKDVFSKTGISSLIGQTEGTVYLEVAFLNNNLTPKYITISDNTNSKRIILASTNVSNQVRIQLVDSVSQVEIFHTLSDITDFNKFAFVYAENNFKFFINGALVGSDNSGTVPSGFNTLLFSNPGNILQFQGDVKSLILFDTAKPDAELINLTTI